MKHAKAVLIASVVAVAAIVLIFDQIILIPDGCVGVQEKNGNVYPEELLPWHINVVSKSSDVFLYCTLTLMHKMRIAVTTNENASFAMEIGIVYSLNGSHASDLHQDYGRYGNFDDIFKETAGTAWQKVARNMSLKDLSTAKMHEAENASLADIAQDAKLKKYGLNIKGVHLYDIRPAKDRQEAENLADQNLWIAQPAIFFFSFQFVRVFDIIYLISAARLKNAPAE